MPPTSIDSCDNSDMWTTLRMMAKIIGQAQGMTDQEAASNTILSAASNRKDLGQVAGFMLKSNPNLVTVPGSRFYGVSAYFGAANCNYTNPPRNFSDPQERFDLIVDGKVNTLADNLNPCTSGIQYVRDTNPANNVRVTLLHSNAMLLQPGDHELGFQLYNWTADGNGNDVGFDLPQIVDMTPQLDQNFVPASVAVGGTSTWTFTITNTSDLQAKPGWSFSTPIPAGLTVSGAATTTCGSANVSTAGGTVTATGNLNNQQTSCTVSVPVTVPNKGTYTAPADAFTLLALNGPDDATISTSQLAMTASVTPESVKAAGDRVSYEFKVTNTGVSELNDIAIDTSGFTGSGSLGAVTCDATTLAANASTTCHLNYTATQTDIEAGDFALTAQASGMAKDAAAKTLSNSETVTVQANPTRSLSISAADPGTMSKAGDQVTYTFTVTNTGSASVDNVAIESQNFTGTGGTPTITCAATTLAPGAKTTCTGTYTVTDADLAAQKVDFTVQAAGTDKAGRVVSDKTTVTVKYAGGGPDAGKSALTLDRTTQTVGGPVVATASVHDSNDFPVAGVVVSLGVDGNATFGAASSPKEGTSQCTTNAQGTCQVTLTDTKAETVAVTATMDVNGTRTALQGSGAKVEFTAGPPVAANSTLELDKKTQTVGEPVVATVTMRDQYGNLVSDQTASLGLTGSGTFGDVATAPVSSTTCQTSAAAADLGSCQVTLSDRVAELIQVSASVGGTPVGGNGDPAKASPQSVQFTPGEPNPNPPCDGTKLTVDKTTLAVGDTANATALITDKYCNPVPNVPVSFSIDPGTQANLSVTTPVTGPDGKAYATLTDNSPDTVKLHATIQQGEIKDSPATVTFTRGGFSYDKSTFTVSPVANPTDQGTWVTVSDGTQFYTGTLTAKDANGNALPNLDVADISFTASSPNVKVTAPPVNNNDGTYSVQYSSTVASATPFASVTYKDVQVGTNLPIPFKAGEPNPNPPCDGTKLTVDKTTLAVGDTAKATALITDTYCNPVAGVPVSFAIDPGTQGILAVQNGTTDADGKAYATLTDTSPEAVTLHATIPQGEIKGSPATVTFTSGGFSYDKSTFTVSPVANPADQATWVTVSDGTPYYTGTLTAKDANGNPLPNLDVADMAFTASSTNVKVTAPAVNNNDGTYSVQYSSTVASATPTAAVTYKGIQVGTSLPIPFKAGEPNPNPPCDGTKLTVDKTNLAVGDTATATALITDSFCNPVPGVPVTFAIDPGTQGQLNVPSATTGPDGKATATLTDNTPESVVLHATIPQGEIKGSPATVTFTTGGFSYDKSTFTVTPVANLGDQATWVTVSEGTQYYTGTLAAKDSDGNPLPNLALTDIAFTASSPDVTVTSTTNNNDGTYTVQYSSKKASPDPTAAVAYKNGQVGTNLPIPFKAGEPNPNPPCDGTGLSIDKPTLSVGDTATATALITDSYCNPVAGVPVSFTIEPGTQGQLVVTTGTTGPDGKAYATLTDNSPDTVTLHATIPQGEIKNSPATVTFTTGGFSYDKSTFTVTPVANPADPATWVTVSSGAEYYTGTLAAKDSDGNPLPNLTLSDIAFTASSTNVTVTNTTNNNDGTYTVHYWSTKAAADPTAAVAYKNGQVGTNLPIPFKAGEPNPNPPCDGTGLSVDKTTLAVGDTANATAFITDSYCNPVAGVPVSFSIDPGTQGILDVQSGTTDANGKAYATLTDTTPESVNLHATIAQGEIKNSPATVTFTQGGFSYDKSTFTVTPVANPADQATWVTVSDGTQYYTGTLAAKDNNGNPLPNLALSDIAFTASSPNVTVTSVTNNNDGTYFVHYSSTKAAADPTAAVTYKNASVGTNLPIPFKAGEPNPNPPCDGAGLSVDKTALLVGETATATAFITDSYCNPVAGVPVDFTIESGTQGQLTVQNPTTGPDGKAYATLTDNTAEPVVLHASIPQGEIKNSPVTVTFANGGGDTRTSTWVIRPAGPLVVGEGVDNTYIATATIKDAQGNVVPATVATFAITPDGPVFDQPSCLTDAQGTCSVTVHSTIAGTYTVSASIAAGAIKNADTGELTQTIQWVADQVCSQLEGCEPVNPDLPAELRTRVEVTTDNQTADGQSQDVATVWAFDKWGNPVVNAVVASTTTDKDLTIQSPIAPISADGSQTIAYTSIVAGKHVADVTVNDLRPVGTPITLTFVPGDVCVVEAGCVPEGPGENPDRQTRVEVTVDNQPVDGQPDQATAYAFDKFGNEVPGVTFDFAKVGSGDDLVIDPTCVTGADGTCTVDASAMVAGTHQATASVKGTELTGHGSPLTFTFVAGDVCVVEAGCVPEGPGTDLAKQTSVSVTVNDRPIIVGVDVITAKAFDKYGNVVSNVKFDITTTDSALVLGGAGRQTTITTGSDGTGTANATSEVSGSHVARGSVNGTELINHGSPLDVRFWDRPVITSPKDGDVTNTNPVDIEGLGQHPGDKITVTGDNDQPVCTATVQPDNTWTCSAPFQDGPHTITAVETHPDGTDSLPSDKVNFTVDTTPPNPPVITEPTGDKPINNNTPPIKGTGDEPGNTVTVNEGDDVVCTAVVQPDKTWSCTPTKPFPDGPHTITGKETDKAGNESKPSEPVDFTVDTTAPNPPVITEPTGDKPVNTATPPIKGTGDEPGNTITVKEGDNTVCTAVVQPDKTWSCTPTKPFPEGPHTITATETDQAGNESKPSEPVTFTVDTTAPNAPVITEPKGDKPLNTNTPTIKGTGDEPGNTITVNEGGNVVCTATVQPDKTWSCVPTKPFPDGDHTITATETDKAGNVSKPSNSVTFNVDTTPPSAPVLNPSNGSEITGTTEPGTTVTITESDGSPVPGCTDVVPDAAGNFSCTPTNMLPPGTTIEAKATDKAGNQSPPTSLVIRALQVEVAYPTRHPLETQIVTGRNFNPGEKVCLTMGSPSVDLGCKNADSDGLVTFSFTVPEGTPAGTQTVTVTGATSGSVSTTFEVLSSSKISVATGGVVIPRVSLSVTLIRLAVVMATVARG